MTEASPTIDIEQARKFLELLDPNAPAFTFQTFDDSNAKRSPLTKVLHGTLDQHAAELKRLNQAGAGVYVTINETDGSGRRQAENIVRVRALFVDLDGAPLDPVLRHYCPPQIVVSTSEGKYHAYWRVDGLELDEFRDAQEALIEKFNADPSVKDLPRVMRLPGFFHQKGEPQYVHIHSSTLAIPYKADQFRVTKAVAPVQSTATSDPDDAAALRFLETECTKVAEMPEGSRARNNTLNKAAYTLGGLVGAGFLSEDSVRDRLLVAADECGLKRKESGQTITSGLTAGKEAPWTPSMVLDPQDPMRSAVKLIEMRFQTEEGHRLIHRHRETFWRWNGACYDIVDREPMDAVVWKFTDRALAIGKHGPGPFKPTQEKVNGIVHALRARTQLSADLDAPVWLSDDDLPPPVEFMSVKNGLLHLPTHKLWTPTPTYFNTSASDVVYNKDAPPPDQWLVFLDQVFGDDEEAMCATQEFLGYCLLSDTSQQKMLLVVGPPRSGKGTIGRVLRELVGRNSVAGPTMHSLGGEFGLEPLIPRPVAIISDARIGQRTDKAAVTERLLSISGEDTLSVNRKNTSFWHGKLQTRFVILTNELPALSDGSGALANRFIIIMMKNSFLGKEDPGLFDRLKGEMPGILNWAIAGYQRLRERGHFIQPASGQEALDEIESLASPVKAFVRDLCDVGAGLSVGVDELWTQYTLWVEGTGSKFAGTKDWFGRNLRSAIPGLTKGDVYPEGKRTAVYKGIGLKTGIMLQHPDSKGTDDNPEIPFEDTDRDGGDTCHHPA